MQTYQLIKNLFALGVIALALLVSPLAGLAQGTLNIKSMPAAPVASLDFMIYGKQSGPNYFWYHRYAQDFWSDFTNSAQASGLWLGIANDAALVNSASNNLAAALVATNNALAAAIIATNNNLAAAIIATNNNLSAAINTASNLDAAKLTAGTNLLAGQIVSTVPPGVIMAYCRSNIPAGWLECNGASVSATTYPALAAVLVNGAAYAYGGLVSGGTFFLPDLRGRFIRGWDHGAGLDPDAASRTDRGDTTTGDNVGTKQADQFRAHDHGLSAINIFIPGSSGPNLQGGAGNSQITSTSQTTDMAGGNETRPVNINLVYIIKY
jgi:microcystin-dependent protein